MITYDNHVRPYAENFHLVEIDRPTIYRIDKFVRELMEVKRKNLITDSIIVLITNVIILGH